MLLSLIVLIYRIVVLVVQYNTIKLDLTLRKVKNSIIDFCNTLVFYVELQFVRMLENIIILLTILVELKDGQGKQCNSKWPFPQGLAEAREDMVQPASPQGAPKHCPTQQGTCYRSTASCRMSETASAMPDVQVQHSSA